MSDATKTTVIDALQSLLPFLMVMITIGGAWMAMDNRVTILETKSLYEAQDKSDQEKSIHNLSSQITSLKADIRDLTEMLHTVVYNNRRGKK